MAFVGLDVGSGGVRAAAVDEQGALLGREQVALDPGRRTADGGHRLDDSRIVAAAERALGALCRERRLEAAAIAVCGTAGTLCFRNARGEPAAEAVAYDDPRHGSGLGRVEAWSRLLPGAARVVPVADAVLEALGAERGGTDWNNALRLGWDPVARAWPDSPRSRGPGFLPAPSPPGTAAGRVRGRGPLDGALLVRGTTDGCATQLASGTIRPGDWAVSLGTTLVWKSVLAQADATALPRLPPGGHIHRLRPDLWLPGAASNTGGGVLSALEPGVDPSRADAASSFPSGLSAYPLARPGERFPVADASFAGFGLPAAGDPRLHAAILEGVAFVLRLGIERLVAAGLRGPGALRIGGGGARSATWMGVVASALGIPVVAAPGDDAALGAALVAAAAATGAPVGGVHRLRRDGEEVIHRPDAALSTLLGSAYRAFRLALPDT